MIADKLHKPALKNYARRRVVVRGLDETWQADLVNVSIYARYNNGYKYLLTIIDIFSKYAWTVPTKTKSGKDARDVMNSLLKKGSRTTKIACGSGQEILRH